MADFSGGLEADHKSRPVSTRDAIKNTRITVRESQQLRRLQALNLQQQKRDTLRQSSRNFAFLQADADADDDDWTCNADASTEQFHTVLSTKRKRETANEMQLDTQDGDFNASMGGTSSKEKEVSRSLYCDQIMLAEWMDEIPPDLEHKYLVISCPLGKRCLVVAGRGRTICRTRKGSIFDVFESMLPHGSASSVKAHSKDMTVLDCIYSHDENVIWVLDLISWRGTPYHECDTDFRFYWIGQKLNEMAQHADMPTFRQVLYGPALVNNVQSLLGGERQPYAVDGLLFYHRDAHYTAGFTPLCSWVGKEKWSEFSRALEQHTQVAME